MINSYRVFEYLKKKSKLKYYVFVSATTQYQSYKPNYKPSTIFDFDTDYFYHSLNAPNQSLRLDFPLTDVYIERFIMQSATNRDPFNWIIEGSKDAVHFSTLYENVETKLCDEWNIFDGENLGCTTKDIKSYENDQPDYYKSIRIKQTGKDSNNQTILAFSGLDFYGRIRGAWINFYRNFLAQTLKLDSI